MSTEQAPVPVYVDWTHREGNEITGIILFAPKSAEANAVIERSGREPQFLITGGTRRVTLDAFNDYSVTDQFHDTGRPEDVVRRAADWLGLTGYALDVETAHEYRSH